MAIAPLSSAQSHALSAVPDNKALTTKSTVDYPEGIWRDDYCAGCGAPPLFYRAGTTTCSLPSGDGGSQVPSTDGKCWLAVFPAAGADVREFGAKGDGKTDSTAAIQAAMNAIPSGRAVLLGPYLYAVSRRGLVCSHPIEMIGTEGNESFLYGGYSGLRPLDRDTNLLTLTNGCTGSYFGHFYLDMGAAGPNTSGAAIRMRPASNITFSDISMNAPCIGLDLNGNGIKVNRMQITQVAGRGCGGIRIGHATRNGDTVDARVTNSTIQSSQANPADFGMKLEDAGGAFINNDDILYSRIGTWIFPGAGQFVKEPFFYETALGDTTLDLPLVIDTAAASGTAQGLKFVGAWTAAFRSTSGQPGVLILNRGGSANFNGFHFVDLRDVSVPGNGMTILAGADISIDASHICGIADHSRTPSTHVGIELARGVSGVAIRDSTFAATCDGSSVGHPDYQIRLDGNNAQLQITGNSLYGAAYGAVSGEPVQPASPESGSIIANNLGIDDVTPVLAARATIDPGVYSTIAVHGSAPVASIMGCWAGRHLTILPQGAVRFTPGSNIATPLRAADSVPVEAICIGANPPVWYLR